MKSLLVGKHVRVHSEPKNNSEYLVLAHFPGGECVLVNTSPRASNFSEIRSIDVQALAIIIQMPPPEDRIIDL